MRANIVELAAASDQKTAILKAVGDLSGLKLAGSLVLVATYIEPEKKGSIYLPQKRLEESRYQSTVGLVLKKGPAAFKYDGPYPYEGEVPEEGDWVFYRTSDSREIFIRNTSCRLIHSEMINGIVNDPEMVW